MLFLQLGQSLFYCKLVLLTDLNLKITYYTNDILWTYEIQNFEHDNQRLKLLKTHRGFIII